jgi:hypothetical protein
MLSPAGEIVLRYCPDYSVSTYLHLHMFLASLLDILTLDSRKIWYLKTVTADYPVTQQHIPEEEKPHKLLN